MVFGTCLHSLTFSCFKKLSALYHFAVFEKDVIIGGLILVNIDAEKIKMRQVCVSESHQGKGIGNKLVSYAEEWANENNYKIMYCHARQNAIDFYLKLDYKKEGDSFLEVGLEHFKLTKDI